MNPSIDNKFYVPQKLICPLSLRIMRDPVTISDGATFERSSIIAWFALQKKTNPLTGIALENLSLTPNPFIQKQTEEFMNSLMSQDTLASLLKNLKIVKKQIAILTQEQNIFTEKWRQFEKQFHQWVRKIDLEVKYFPHTMETLEGKYWGYINEQNIPSGRGLMEYKNGDKYLGEWNEGEKDGKGRMFCDEEKIYYFGEWKKNKLDGKGCIRLPKNHQLLLFRGQWKGGVKNGVGVERRLDEQVTHQGYWKQGKYEGFGIESRKDGSRYEGIWKNGQKHGIGILYKRESISSQTWCDGILVEDYSSGAFCPNSLCLIF